MRSSSKQAFKPFSSLAPMSSIKEPDAKALLAQLRQQPLPLFPVLPSSALSQATCTSPQLASQIVDGLFHPLLEAALHLLNADLYSAHFLLRKMQADKTGMWLHGILHRMEGDYDNAREWYNDVAGTKEPSSGPPTELFTKIWGTGAQAQAFIDRVQDLKERLQKSGKLEKITARQRRKSSMTAPNEDVLAQLRKDSASAIAAMLHEMNKDDEEQDEVKGDEDWEMRDLHGVAVNELCTIAEACGDQWGWGSWNDAESGRDGTAAYTGSTEGQKEIMKGMAFGGEGIRSF